MPGDSSSSPGKTLAAATRPAPTEQITLESTAPKGQGFGRHPRDGMHIFVKTFKIRYALRRRQPLAGSQPRKTTRPPASALPGMTAGASARPLPGPRQGPCRVHPQGHHQPPPPHACSCRPNQLGRHLRGGMQIFVKTHHCATSAACLPTWHRRRRWPGRVSTQEGAATNETGFSPVPDKARTPKQDALNAPCHVMRGITSHHCTLSTSCVPLWQPLFL